VDPVAQGSERLAAVNMTTVQSVPTATDREKAGWGALAAWLSSVMTQWEAGIDVKQDQPPPRMF